MPGEADEAGEERVCALERIVALGTEKSVN